VDLIGVEVIARKMLMSVRCRRHTPCVGNTAPV